MEDLGSKLAVGGFAAQGAAGLALGLTYVFAGDALSDVFAGQTGGAPPGPSAPSAAWA